MTIKKLTLSAIVASALATSAFAANIVDINDSQTFNTYYVTQTLTTDTNISAVVDYNTTTTGISTGNYVSVTLAGDITFPSVDDADAGDWTLQDQAAATYATGAQFRSSGTELLMTISTTIGQDDNLTLVYTGAGNVGSNPMFILSSSADQNSTVTLKGSDSNFINLANTTGTVTVAGIGDTTHDISGTLTCATSVVIDSTNRNVFTTTSSDADTNTTYHCDLNVSQVTSVDDIDYDYSDVDFTVSFANANLVDGNYSATGTATDTISGTTQTMTFTGADLLTGPFDKQITYTLASTAGTLNPISAITGTATASVNNKSIAVATDDTALVLNTFSGTVKYLRTGTGVSTAIKLFNSDTTKAAAYTIDITDVDGNSVGTVNSVVSVPAGGSSSISAAAIKALAEDQLSVTLANGFSVTINYTDVAKTNGDMSATQQDAAGKYSLRVNHNNTVDLTSVYQGL